ncbi:MAG: glutamate--tRNA ligase [Candidatus Omnitrophota bacterium]|nr:glutamate--tRNA ligase [Candidatus Omnitrophota bacterium]
MIRVRFAPSPTGNLHIGGARTALFNWLYARSKQGQFILRIEDTDLSRSRAEYIDEILNSLKWMGFEWDEIYYQSQRFDIYKEYALKALKDGLAYIEKSENRKEAIIFKVTPQKIKITDLIHGEIEFDTSVIKDQVLIKSDGTPTYNFACVVDDALTKITHIIRGDDHISNTPKQALLYQALGFPLPEFAHLPLILAKEGGRMSKRKGATAITEYRQMGYLAQALVNFLMLLGWSPGDNREIIDIKEAVTLFDIRSVNKTAAAMDMDKLDWINNQYLKHEDPLSLTEAVIPMLIEKKYIDKDNFDKNYILSLVKLFQPRLTVLNDFAEWADFFFLKDIAIDPAAEQKFLSQDLSKEFKLFINRLDKLDKFDITTIEAGFRELVAELNIQAKALIHPIRVALTGKTVGPGLFEVIYYLGRERTKERLIKWVKKGGGPC